MFAGVFNTNAPADNRCTLKTASQALLKEIRLSELSEKKLRRISGISKDPLELYEVTLYEYEGKDRNQSVIGSEIYLRSDRCLALQIQA